MTSSGHRGDDERDPAGPRGDRPRARCSSSPAPTTATSTACSPQAGSGLATQGIPASPGVTASAAAATVIVPWNDADAFCRGHRRAPVRGDPRRADSGQHGRRAARRRASSRCCRDRADGERGAARLRRGDHRASGSRAAAPRSCCGVAARPDDHGQDRRRRPAGRRVRRVPGADGADRAGRRRLPGRNAVGQSARGRRRAGHARPPRWRRLRASAGRHRAARRRPARSRSERGPRPARAARVRAC